MKRTRHLFIITLSILLLGMAHHATAEEMIPGKLDPRVKAEILRCDKKAATSFAIITDTKTYMACTSQLLAYRDVLQEEGLGTYLIHADWENPDQVRSQILKIAQRKPQLEGVVLVGDVPIVMIREAQHLTTAFKMNEATWPAYESSVPSDRFYDDFDLQFDYLGRDSLHHDTFYYRLNSKGNLTLRSEIYSARMKVPAKMKGDRYELMRRYLDKVVAAHKEQNVLDNITYFAGHGYNSDCLTIWRQRPLVYREHFPYAFDRASHNRFLNFRQKDKMKENLSAELQRKECDFFQFSEHGAPDVQYINGTSEATGLNDNYEHLKNSIASYYTRYVKGTDDEAAFLHEAIDSAYLLPRSALSDSAMVHYHEVDSIDFHNANLYLEDLSHIHSEPRVLVLNACYNGSFHQDDGYVAGSHIFGEGRCIVAQGNTVNVLQDKWEDKLLGYLSMGERIGMWQKEINFLESHLIGDPTFRFSCQNEEEAELCRQLHHDLVFSPTETEIWKSKLDHPQPLIRAAAITHLSYSEGNWSSEALKLLQEDLSWNVRLSALTALGKYMDENTEAGLKAAFEDPYEVIVRTACRIAGASGDIRYIPELERVIQRRPELARVPFIAETALKVLEGKAFSKNIDKISDKELKDSRRMDAMRSFRNNRVLAAIDPLLKTLKDSDNSQEIRKVAAEVLGWYDQSIQRDRIRTELEEWKKNQAKKEGDVVIEEVMKTIKRLKWN